jgi:beta-lactamase class A
LDCFGKALLAYLPPPQLIFPRLRRKLKPSNKSSVAGWELRCWTPEAGQRLEHRALERFPMCSTFKFLAAAAVLHRVDLKQDQLTRFITYTKADLLEYAPVTKAHVDEGGMMLGALCAAAIQQSDNTAGNLLLRAIGGPEGLTRYARSLGDKDTRLDRVEPFLNSAMPGDERDTTTPAAMLEDLRVLLAGDALTPAARDQLDAWLAGNETGVDMLRAGLPKDWKVGDKTGRGANGATNDIAILRPPAGDRFWSQCIPSARLPRQPTGNTRFLKSGG